MASSRQTPRGERATFRPRFTLMMLYLLLFFVLYGILFALPDLMEVIRAAGELPDEELQERAREITRGALSGGRVYVPFAAAAVTVGLAAWQRALPGLR